jgi:hypothetical protein
MSSNLKSQKHDNRVVLTGIALGAILSVVMAVFLFLMLPQFDREPSAIARIQLGVKCLVFPGLIFFMTIIGVASKRFGNEAEDPTKMLTSSHVMLVNLRVQLNTEEQILLFLINTLSLCVLLPFEYLSLLPIFSIIFVIARVFY